jgi:hypothetical protein
MFKQVFRHSRMLQTLIVLLLATVFCLSLPARAESEEAAPRTLQSNPDEVGDFALLDQEGRFHQLRRRTDSRALVLVTTGNGCPIARESVPKLKALRKKFSGKKVVFWMLDANPQDDRASVVAEANEFNVDFPILLDEAQLVARSLGVKRTAEAICINTKDWTVFYRGAIDDQLSIGAKKVAPTENYLEDALAKFLAGEEIATKRTQVAGCLIRFESNPLPPDDPKFYAQQVAPILQRKCVSCHSAGNIGPFAMSSYKKVKGWSDTMREMLLTKRMPPWHADPHYGVFREDRSLTTEELKTLVSWIDAGAPAGQGADPLNDLPVTASEWTLGKPDYVVALSEPMQVPATGVVDYITNIVDSPILENAWLRAAVIRPDNRKVLHHVIVYLEYPPGHRDENSWEKKWLVGWAPGAKMAAYPEGTGKFLPKGCKLRFQLHYTTMGKEQTDRTELGLYLYQERPARELQMRGVAQGDFHIPANVADSRTLAIQPFPRDAVIYELAPHMHKRGSWFKYEALYPDGKFEVLLSVPKYDFNWQTSYRFAEPKRVPAGTRILCTGGFDNSTRNPDNPDPTKDVRWGDQSFDEMFIGFMSVAEVPVSSGKAQAQARVEN